MGKKLLKFTPKPFGITGRNVTRVAAVLHKLCYVTIAAPFPRPSFRRFKGYEA